MPSQEQGLDFLLVFACLQFCIAPAMCNIGSGVEISMGLEATHDTAKRLLIGSIGFVRIVALTALLRRIRSFNLCGRDTSFGRIPGNLLGHMPQVGSTHVSIHAPGFVLHRCHGKLLIGELCIRVFSKALVDRAIC